MKSTTLRVLLVLAVVVIAGIVWRYASTKPLYSHDHGESAGHSHEHVHDGATTHDHTHMGLIGRTSHAHSHVHQHTHEPIDASFEERLTEIGHLHLEGERSVYWVSVKGDVQAKTVTAEFWTNEDGEIVKTACDQKELMCSLILGGSSKSKLNLTEDSGDYVGQIPEDIDLLPHLILSIESISLNGNEFSGFRAPVSTE